MSEVYTTMDEWFLALPAERQVVLTQDKWMLANAAFDAGVLGKDHTLKVLKAKATNTLANNLCSDHRDKQVGKPCLACVIEKLERENSVKSDLIEALVSDLDQAKDRLRKLGVDDAC